MLQPWSFAVVVTGAANAALAELAATPEAAVNPLTIRFAPLVPGNIAYDACDCDGQLAFTILRIVPTVTYPIDASNSSIQGGCDAPAFFAECIASFSRCVPGMSNTGTAPSTAALFASALLFQGAQYGLRNGLTGFLCEEKRNYRIRDYRIGASIFPGPEGNCAAVEIPFSFLLSS